jgi:Tol biopolymer transport system component
VLRDQPPLDRLAEPSRTLIARCLEKDPKRRLRDIGDALALLDAPDRAASAPASVNRRPFLAAAGLALVATIGAVALAVTHFTEAPPPAPLPVRFEVRPPGSGLLGPNVALSPNGRMVAFTASGGDAPGLWVHSLETGVSRRLVSAGATGSVMFWSADGRQIAYAAGAILRKVNVADDQVQTVSSTPAAGWTGGSWNADNVIVFGGASFGVMQVPASGGTPKAVTVLDPARNDIGHVGPTFLPDGRRFLYFRNTPNAESRGIYVGSLDLAPAAQSSQRIAVADSRAFYMPGPAGTGHLLFLRQGILFAQPFDVGTLAVSGEPTQLAEGMSTTTGDVPFGAAGGTVLFRSNTGATGTPVWVSRAGAELEAIGAEVMTPQYPRISPDGKRMALVVSGEIWVYDLQGRPPVKVTLGDDAFSPVWTPDGKSLVYESNDAPTLLKVAASTGATPQAASPNGHFHPHAWSPDGRLIAAQFPQGSPATDIVRLVAEPSSMPEFLVKTEGRDGAEGTALSPDGKWLAYASNATGSTEVWVQPFPGPGTPIRISPRGGMEPVWARNGRELYYLERSRMMAVAVTAKQEFDFTAPVPLFDFRYRMPTQPPAYDVAPDGRFLVIKPSPGAQTGIGVITNWSPAASAAR